MLFHLSLAFDSFLSICTVFCGLSLHMSGKGLSRRILPFLHSKELDSYPYKFKLKDNKTVSLYLAYHTLASAVSA